MTQSESDDSRVMLPFSVSWSRPRTPWGLLDLSCSLLSPQQCDISVAVPWTQTRRPPVPPEEQSDSRSMNGTQADLILKQKFCRKFKTTKNQAWREYIKMILQKTRTEKGNFERLIRTGWNICKFMDFLKSIYRTKLILFIIFTSKFFLYISKRELYLKINSKYLYQ